MTDIDAPKRKIPWIAVIGVTVSLSNLILLGLGAAGAWRDRVVLGDAKVEALTLSAGKTEGRVESIAADMTKLVNSTGTISGDVSRLKEDVSDIKDTQGELGKAVNDLQRRTDVLETLRARPR